MVVDALHQVGAARSIVIDEENVILAGNGVTEAAAEAGITKVRVVDVAGDELVAVRRTGLTDEQKRRLAMYDNRTAELAEWNVEQLLSDVRADLAMQPWFSDQELAKLLSINPPAEAAPSETLNSQFLVVVTCQSEQEQVQLLERFCAEGLECKALVS
jgi:phage/plasmid-associated DNA primase